MPLGLTAAVSATDPVIHKKLFGLGTALIISNEKKNDITKIVKSLVESGLLKVLVKQLKMKQKNKKAKFSLRY